MEKTKKILFLTKPIQCKYCELVHAMVPAGARFLRDDPRQPWFYFECFCQNTLTARFTEVKGHKCLEAA